MTGSRQKQAPHRASCRPSLHPACSTRRTAASHRRWRPRLAPLDADLRSLHPHSEPPRTALSVRTRLAPVIVQLPTHPARLELAAAGCDQVLLISRRRDRDLPGGAWDAAGAYLEPRLAAAAAEGGGHRCVHALHTGDESFASQLALLGVGCSQAAQAHSACARVLIGSHGANLVNMIWSPGPLAVVEVVLDSERARFSNYWHTARLGLRALAAAPSRHGHSQAGSHGGPQQIEQPERLWRIVETTLGAMPLRLRPTS